MNTPPANPSGILVEAEDFDDIGGWVIDSQFETLMGSPYLLAHGIGCPVADATTKISIACNGEYEVWVRAKDWVPSHSPGRFKLKIDGMALEPEFGANGKDWSWQSAGKIALKAGKIELALSDLTGFDGRCDAIYFGLDGIEPPNTVDEASRSWRRQLRGLPAAPVDGGTYDVIVVGGGISGCAAALTAARLGQTVALLQDRPVLGGNASVEIGLSPRGSQGSLLQEFAARTSDGDLQALALLQAEPTATVFLEHRVIAAHKDGGKITSINAVAARGGQERRFLGKTFIDATGTALLGRLCGAETLFGREAKAAFGEPLAPDTADEMHHGNTIFFRTRQAASAVSFPDVPWATEVSREFGDLGGQLVEPGQENGRGPKVAVSANVPSVEGFAFGLPCAKIPATHFWEYGQWLDPYKDAEHIRDHLLRALYGTFATVKRTEPEKYANLEFEWVAFVPGQGEFHRYLGDYVLSEIDIRNHKQFEDAVVFNDGAFCMHCAFERGETDYDFRIKEWIWDERDGKPYVIPFRCLYSRNFDNLLAAGKHISITHVAGSNVKFMGNGAQHGIAVGAAAYLSKKHGKTPREIGRDHIQELRDLAGDIGCEHHKTEGHLASEVAE
jgi:hypothetical protein